MIMSAGLVIEQWVAVIKAIPQRLSNKEVKSKNLYESEIVVAYLTKGDKGFETYHAQTYDTVTVRSIFCEDKSHTENCYEK